MNRLLEMLFTYEMRDFPYEWAGSHEEGAVSEYCDKRGFVLRGPKKGELVFKSSNEGSPAYKVTYVNENTRRIKVQKTDFVIKYNQIHRDYRRNSRAGKRDPDGSKVSLGAVKK